MNNDSPKAPLGRPEHLIAKRYRLQAHIGHGAHGEVWRAHDEITNRDVAVKLLRPELEIGLARMQNEVASLRQRLPNVVELLDDGIDNGLAYLVMDLIQGQPFPGQPSPCGWSDIADITIMMLETLHDIHSASVIHRDLKPENILITSEGQIRFLDFGLAYRPTASTLDRLTSRYEVLGTPLYVAPEQFQGSTASEQSDLYAVGIMLYMALSGSRPHEAESIEELFYARINCRPPPLRQIAHNVPDVVARIIDKLLAIDLQERPRSAMEVLCMLRGEPSIETEHFPWLGSQTSLLDLVTAARNGQSLDIVGPPGSGRTRHLLAVEQSVRGTKTIQWVLPAELPFMSLAPIVGLRDKDRSLTLAEVATWVENRLMEVLAAGTVILVDDAEHIDAHSQRVLERHRHKGTILRAYLPESVMNFPAGQHRVLFIHPLSCADLRALFAGPDRLLHVREDAAVLLLRRTEGHAASVTREVTTWVRLGIAHWMRNLLVVQREAIQRMELGLLVPGPHQPADQTLWPRARYIQDVLAWIGLAWPHTHVEQLQTFSEEPRYVIEDAIDCLVQCNLVRRLDDQRIEPRGAAMSAHHKWTREQRQRAHKKIAQVLAPGETGRLWHLHSTGDDSESSRLAIGREAVALSIGLLDVGRLQQAEAVIERGIQSLRGIGPAALRDMERLLGLWVETAIALGGPHALDRVLYVIHRTDPRSDRIHQLEQLAQIALHIDDWTGRPLQQLQTIKPFDDERLERVRLGICVAAARHMPDKSEEEQMLQHISALVAPDNHELAASLHTWWGRLRYRQGRFLEAAALHAKAAASTTSPLVRVYSQVTGALALMEAFDFDVAYTLAEQGRDAATKQRHTYYEMFATWILRAIDYRLERAKSVDMELMAAIAHVGAKELEGVLYLNEAAIGWRIEDKDAAVMLAERAYKSLSNIGQRSGTLLAQALLVVLQSPIAEAFNIAEAVALATGKLLPGIGIQAMALLVIGGRLSQEDIDEATIVRLCEPVPRAQWAVRMDIMSIDECLTVLHAGARA